MASTIHPSPNLSPSLKAPEKMLSLVQLLSLAGVMAAWVFAEWLLLKTTNPFWFVTGSLFISGFALAAGIGIVLVDHSATPDPENAPGEGS